MMRFLALLTLAVQLGGAVFPPTLTFLNTTEGTKLLETATHQRPFFQLVQHFATELPALCGPTTAVIILNALRAQGLPAPLSNEYSYHFGSFVQNYNYWDQHNVWNGSDVDCVMKAVMPWEGSLEQVSAFFSCRSLDSRPIRALNSSIEEFRQSLIVSFSHEPLRFVAVNVDRQAFGQAGAGHHSPVGAYDARTDKALFMDVARYRFPPFWISVPDLFEAMVFKGHDEKGATPRGYIVVGMRPQQAEDRRSGESTPDIAI